MSVSCQFIAEKPIQHKQKDGFVWIKCESSCGIPVFDPCPCRGENRCVDRWHRMENIAGTVWAPYPVGSHNHTVADKAVRGLDI